MTHTPSQMPDEIYANEAGYWHRSDMPNGSYNSKPRYKYTRAASVPSQCTACKGIGGINNIVDGYVESSEPCPNCAVSRELEMAELIEDAKDDRYSSEAIGIRFRSVAKYLEAEQQSLNRGEPPEMGEKKAPITPLKPSVIEGWKLVPMDPDYNMKMHGIEHIADKSGNLLVMIEEVYKSMLSAAPPHTETERG